MGILVQGHLGPMWAVLLALTVTALLAWSTPASAKVIDGGCDLSGVDSPRVLWAQREELLYVRVVLPDLEEDSVHVEQNDTHLLVRARATRLDKGAQDATEGFEFCLLLEFFRRVESSPLSESVTKIAKRKDEVVLTITKKWHWLYWPRLHRSPSDPLRSKVGVDWKRWKAEDDEEGGTLAAAGEDDEWLDDEVAATKVASFPEEEYDDDAVPLLDGSQLTSHLEGTDLTLLLCFERSRRCRGCRQLSRLLAHVAAQIDGERGKLSIARIDGDANFEAMKRLHVTSYPQLRLFFRDGGTFDVDVSQIRDSRQLMAYLASQLTPAFEEASTAEELEEALRGRGRAAVLVAGEGGAGGGRRAEKAFDWSANKFRASVAKHTDLGFVKTTVGAVLSLAAEGGSEDGNLASALSDAVGGAGRAGLVILKAGEDAEWFAGGKWRAKSVHAWLRQRQFKLVEEITPANFPEFRRRGTPMLYLLLAAGDGDGHGEILSGARELARECEGKIAFVHTFVGNHSAAAADLVQHLRCDFDGGSSFAVLEDFREEYRYCVEAGGKRGPLTVDRIARLARGFVARVGDALLSPDKLRSKPVPSKAKNLGPVYDVVGENLLEVVLDPRKDVVIHFYSPVDEAWDFDETELVKAAEALEGEQGVLFGKIDGFRNEKPKEFPDIGYFPTTLIFPSDRKNAPAVFNKTEGFLKDRILDWVGEHAASLRGAEEGPVEAAKDEL